MLSYAGSQYFYGRNRDLQTKISGIDTTKYTYDALGNLMQVVMPPKGQANGDVIQYVIDSQNRRIGKKVNGKWINKWLYAGQLTPIAELDSANSIIAHFSGGYMNKRDTIYQIFTDHLGSSRLVVNVAKVALADNKVLLNKLGITVRTMKTKAQRNAPKKAAATRAAKRQSK